jgi:hypothetical protein
MNLNTGSLKLYELTAAYQMLADADAQDDEGFAAALAQLSDAIEHKAEQTAAVIRTLELEADAIDAEAKRLRERAAARRNRVESLKVYLMEQLTAAGKVSVQGKLFTVGVQASPPSVQVVDPMMVPEAYLLPQAPKVDARAILTFWRESGTVPPGVEVQQGQHLRIR